MKMKKINYEFHDRIFRNVKPGGLLCPKCSKLVTFCILKSHSDYFKQLITVCKNGQLLVYCSVKCMIKHNHYFNVWKSKYSRAVKTIKSLKWKLTLNK